MIRRVEWSPLLRTKQTLVTSNDDSATTQKPLCSAYACEAGDFVLKFETLYDQTCVRALAAEFATDFDRRHACCARTHPSPALDDLNTLVARRVLRCARYSVFDESREQPGDGVPLCNSARELVNGAAMSAILIVSG